MFNPVPEIILSARAVDRSYNLFYDVGFRVVAVNSAIDRVYLSDIPTTADTITTEEA